MGIEGNDCLSAEIILVKTSGEDATHMRNTFPLFRTVYLFSILNVISTISTASLLPEYYHPASADSVLRVRRTRTPH